MSTLVFELIEDCIIAAEFDGGVIIGGDSRSIKGEFVSNDFLKKFTQVRKQIYIFGHGLHSEIQNTLFQVTKEVRRTEKLNDPDKANVLYVANLVGFFINLLEQTENAYIVAGWDERRGAQVYYISERGLNVRYKIAVLGTGKLYEYAYGEYVENMTEDACVKFVEQGVRLFIKRPAFRPGPIKMIKCNENGSYGKIIPITSTPSGETVSSGTDIPFILIDWNESSSSLQEDPVEEEQEL